MPLSMTDCLNISFSIISSHNVSTIAADTAIRRPITMAMMPYVRMSTGRLPRLGRVAYTVYTGPEP